MKSRPLRKCERKEGMKKILIVIVAILLIMVSPFHIMTCVEKDSSEITFEYNGNLYSAYFDGSCVNPGERTLVLTGKDDNGTTIEWFF